MRVEIQDTAALASIPAANVLAHLKSRGWTEEGVWRQRAWIFGRELDGRHWEVLVPQRDAGPGYARNMFETVKVLSEVELVSQFEVFHSLVSAGSDTVRFSSASRNPNEAPSLHRSMDLSGSAYDLLTSAGRSVENPSPAFRGRIPKSVSDYLATVTPIPGYFDDFDLLVHSPVPPKLQGSLVPNLPFSRRVTQKLANGLETTELAIATATKDGGLSAFDNSESLGVSANLCAAISQLAEHHDIEISTTWASIHPSNVLAATYRFRQESAEVLNDARIYLSSRAPRLDEDVTGNVVLLKRGPQDVDGLAHIVPDRTDLPETLAVKFENPAYEIVIDAFQKQVKVRLTADIYTIGRSHELRNARGVQVLSDSSDAVT